MVSQHYGNGLRTVFRGFLATANIPWVNSLPIRRSIQSIGAVDSGVDAWAEALSGIGPLILLVGERNTKQLLREMRGVHSIFSLAFAPLGLISVLISMIRLCGGHRLRSYLGYEHEARCNSASEVTRVNCGSIHAEVVDGSIGRSTVPDPTSQAFAVTLVQGQSETTIIECLQQIRACEAYQSEKQSKRCPPDTANINWCFRVTAPVQDDNAANAILYIVSEALNIPNGSMLHRSLTRSTTTASDLRLLSTRSTTLFNSSVYSSKGDKNSIYASGKPTEKEDCDFTLSLPKPLKVTFLCTFEGLSEFSVSPPPHKFWSFLIASISLLSMLAVQLLCLRAENGFSVGWIMVFVGYVGMTGGVAASAWLIYSSQQMASLTVRQPRAEAEWTHGVMVAVKNTDSLDTSGTRLLRNGDAPLSFEAVWLRELTWRRTTFAWAISISLALFFVCHYLGLRSSRWWLPVSELMICLTAAFARSVIKFEQSEAKFSADPQIFLDKRCYSTGILGMKRASRISAEQRTSDTLDLRVYSFQASNCLPLTGDLIAWRAAKLCLQNPKAAERILKVVDMTVRICPGSTPSQRRVVATYLGGVLTQEGLAFPNSQICLAFPCPMADLAAPTPLLARGLMRQSQWSVEYENINKTALPYLGGTYITSFDSLITWWTIAEDRNDASDQHKNLHGSLILINIAFFLSVLHEYAHDEALIAEINKAHESASAEDENFATAIVDFFVEKLVDEE